MTKEKFLDILANPIPNKVGGNMSMYNIWSNNKENLVHNHKLLLDSDDVTNWEYPYITHKGRSRSIFHFLQTYPPFLTKKIGDLNSVTSLQDKEMKSLTSWAGYNNCFDLLVELTREIKQMCTAHLYLDRVTVAYHSGDDLVKYGYTEEFGAPRSCMTTRHARETYGHYDIIGNEDMQKRMYSVDLYRLNPERVRLMTVADPQESGNSRALVWKLDNGTVFMDRVYPCHNAVQNVAFRIFARNKGWIFREQDGQTTRNLDHKEWSHSTSAGQMNVTQLVMPPEKWLPWFDTFRVAHATKVDSDDWNRLHIFYNPDEATRFRHELNLDPAFHAQAIGALAKYDSIFGQPCLYCNNQGKGYQVHRHHSVWKKVDDQWKHSPIMICSKCALKEFVSVTIGRSVALAPKKDVMTVGYNYVMKDTVDKESMVLIGIGQHKGQLWPKTDCVLDYKMRWMPISEMRIVNGAIMNRTHANPKYFNAPEESEIVSMTDGSVYRLDEVIRQALEGENVEV